MSHPTDRRDRFLRGCKKGSRRAKRLLAGNCFSDPKEHEKCVAKTAKLTRHTTKLCSCAMCGNPRKFFGEKTIQEQKAEDSDKKGS